MAPADSGWQMRDRGKISLPVSPSLGSLAGDMPEASGDSSSRTFGKNMKTILISLLTLIAGVCVGLWYGWSTGVVDGQTHAMLGMLPVIQKYGAFRDTDDVEERDKMMDVVTIACMATFADGKSHSPMFMFFHPKANAGLIDAVVAWELDHPKEPKLDLSPASPTAIRIAEVEKMMTGYWEKELERQKKKRQETKQKAEQARPANLRPSGTSVTSPADPASRAGDAPEASGDS